jgi:serine acetyltransferase
MMASAGTNGSGPTGVLDVKSTWRDFVVAGIFISLLLAASIGIVWLLHPYSARWLGPYHVLFDAALVFVGFGLLSAILVRIVLAVRPVQAGEYESGSAGFSQWMLLTVLYRLGQGALWWCMPFYMRPVVETLFGARLGADVVCGGKIDDPYQIVIGDATVLGDASLVSGNYLKGGKLTCGPVVIGKGVTIGSHCVVLPNTTIGDGSVLMSGSYLMPGASIPPGETWRGNPARKWM